MRRAALAILLAASLAGCHKKDAEAVATEAAVAVKVERAHVGEIQSVVTATGTVDPAPGADWTILAPTAARVVSMPKAEGDRVRRGDLLVKFDAPNLRADVAARETDLQTARADLENARKNDARVALLLEKGIAARKEREDARKQLQTAQAAVSGAESALANARDLLSRATVYALFDGIVAKRSHNPGDLVDGTPGDPVLRVIDPSRLQVAVSVPVSALGKVALGSKARVLVPGAPEDTASEGRVLSRPANVDPATGTAPVRVSVAGALSAGTPVQVEIVAESHKDVVIVPAPAVVREEDKPAVFVVGADNKAHRRDVTLGLENESEVEITHGVAAGERVVIEGQDELPDGATVTVG